MSWLKRIRNLFRKKPTKRASNVVVQCDVHSFNIRKNGKITIVRSTPVICNKTLSTNCRINCPDFSKAFDRDSREFYCPHASGKYVFRNIIDNREVGNNFTEINDGEF